MELVEGKTLRELIAAGALPLRELLQIGSQTAEGLARAHSGGIVHRDLKPDNLMVSGDGFVKILDFGLAKMTALRHGPEAIRSSRPRRGADRGHGAGNAAYMSPEQASGRPLDFRSDQFSLGCVLYEMATGKRPFHRETVAETLTAIIREEPEPIGSRSTLAFRRRCAGSSSAASPRIRSSATPRPAISHGTSRPCETGSWRSPLIRGSRGRRTCRSRAPASWGAPGSVLP